MLEFISALVNRRKRLQELAQSSLPPFELSKYKLGGDAILDIEAGAVAKALQNRGVSVEPAVMPSQRLQATSVYHASYLTATTLDILYDVGFRDVDDCDDVNNLTPLWKLVQCHQDQPYSRDFSSEIIQNLHVTRWFQFKGVSIYSTHIVTGTSVLHALGARIGLVTYRYFAHCIRDRNSGRQKISRNPLLVSENAEEDFLLNNFTDGFVEQASCFCCRGEYHAINSAIKRPNQAQSSNIFEYCLWDWSDYTEEQVRTALFEAGLCLATLVAPEHQRCPWLAAEIIRVMAFNELGLTQTCNCSPIGLPTDASATQIRKPFADEEAVQIHEEERLLIQKLEDLVAEFDAKYEELGIPLTEFLTGYWRTRMDEVLKRDEKLYTEEVKKMREVGVIVEDADDHNGDGDGDDDIY
jgi:hypothetical protein